MLKMKRTKPAPSGEVFPWFMRVLDRTQGLFERHGIDYGQLRLIVNTKFTLASRDRRASTFGGKPKAESSHPLRSTFLLNFLVGLVLIFLAFLPVPLLAFTTFFATLFLFVFLTMLTNYSSLMLDPRDRVVYASRGVSLSTISAARLIVVGFYLILNVIAVGLPMSVAVLLKDGPLVFLGMLLGVIGIGLFAFTLALFIYLLVLRFFDGERLKNVLNIVQIAMTIGLYAGSQILPRINGNVYSSALHINPWIYLAAVPSWFAGPALLFMGRDLMIATILTVAGVIATGALTWIYFANAANFERYLAKLDQSSDERRKDGWYYRLTAKLLTRPGFERTYYDFGWKVLREQRAYKLRVYPQFAYSLVLFIVFPLGFVQGGGMSLWQFMARVIGFSPLIFNIDMPLAVYMLQFSDQPEAMRLFQRVPLRHDAELLLATIKVLYGRLFLPFGIVISLVSLFIAGWPGFLAAIASTVGMLEFVLIFGRILNGNRLPFAREFDARNQKAGVAASIAVFVMLPIDIGIIAAGAFLQTWIFGAALLVVFTAIAWFVARSYRHGVVLDVNQIDVSDN